LGKNLLSAQRAKAKVTNLDKGGHVLKNFKREKVSMEKGGALKGTKNI